MPRNINGAIFLIGGITHRVALARTCAAESVVTAAGVGNDGEEPVAAGRHEHGAGGEVERGLVADGVGRAVAVGGIVGIVEEGVGGLVALDIHDAENLATFDFVRPGVAGWNDLAVVGRARVEGARGQWSFVHGHWGSGAEGASHVGVETIGMAQMENVLALESVREVVTLIAATTRR